MREPKQVVIDFSDHQKVSFGPTCLNFVAEDDENPYNCTIPNLEANQPEVDGDEAANGAAQALPQAVNVTANPPAPEPEAGAADAFQNGGQLINNLINNPQDFVNHQVVQDLCTAVFRVMMSVRYVMQEHELPRRANPIATQRAIIEDQEAILRRGHVQMNEELRNNLADLAREQDNKAVVNAKTTIIELLRAAELQGDQVFICDGRVPEEYEDQE